MSFRIPLLLWIVFLPVAALAATPPAVTIDAAFDRQGELAVTVTSHMASISAVTMQATAAGELFSVDPTPVSLYLPLEVPVTVTVPAHVSRTGRFGSAIVRLTNDRETVQVVEIGFVRNGAAIRRAPRNDYAAFVNGILDDRDAVAAEKRAEGLLQSVLARGKVPAAISGAEVPPEHGKFVENSNFERAWNRLVGQYNAARGTTVSAFAPNIVCGPYTETPNNVTYSVTGTISYDDAYFGNDRALQQTGYSGFVTTNVEYENDCYVVYRVIAFSFTTSWSGSFSTSVRTITDPSVSDPILYVSTTAPDVGERTCANTCTSYVTQQQLAYPPDDRFVFSGGVIQLRPHYTSANAPSRYFFHWNDELKSLKSRWTGAGFGSYASFTASHDSSVGNGAYFYPVSPGIIAFADNGEWMSPWLMAHESGHFFQFKLQGNVLGGGQVHSVCQVISVGPAFREGFADWHGSYWETDGRSIYQPCSGGECYSNCPTGGYSVELNVASFFWDLFDYTNDATYDQSQDSVTYGLSFFSNWGSHDFTSCDDFFYNMLGRGVWGSNEPAVRNLRTVNRVEAP